MSREVDELLVELRRRGGVLYVFGPKDGPEVLAHVYRWPSCADVMILRGEDDATAYRVSTLAGTDVFTPVLVSWQYHSTAVWTLRAVLTLPPPGDVHAPIAVLRPDPQCFLPANLGRPITIRPTSIVGSPVHVAQPRHAEGVHR
ncbi:hypothetical protein [Saccharopolyspora thermophila]|uniref:SseB protein N-terminal domain-containing protein n=1 Tax=Saccharopolyspora thermophila TaxID=89367 RepID=A0ABN1C5F4_9PSEU